MPMCSVQQRHHHLCLCSVQHACPLRSAEGQRSEAGPSAAVAQASFGKNELRRLGNIRPDSGQSRSTSPSNIGSNLAHFGPIWSTSARNVVVIGQDLATKFSTISHISAQDDVRTVGRSGQCRSAQRRIHPSVSGGEPARRPRGGQGRDGQGDEDDGLLAVSGPASSAARRELVQTLSSGCSAAKDHAALVR